MEKQGSSAPCLWMLLKSPKLKRSVEASPPKLRWMVRSDDSTVCFSSNRLWMREDFPEELAPNTRVTGAKVMGPVSVQDLNCFRCREVNIAVVMPQWLGTWGVSNVNEAKLPSLALCQEEPWFLMHGPGSTGIQIDPR